jgi:Na+/phosphate symporter
MMTITVPALAALIGVLLYALSANGKVQEIGRILFFCGLLVALLAFTRGEIKVFP